MFEFIDQSSIHFEELSAMQFGWGAEFTQLGHAEQASRINLVQSDNAGICRFLFNSKFDQRVFVQPGYYSFGLLEPDTTPAFVQGKTAPSGALLAFPRQEEAHGVSSAGFHGNGIHFKQTYLEAIAETAFKIPLRLLVSATRIFALNRPLLNSLRGELHKWRQMAAPGTPKSAPMLAHREEALAIAVLNGGLCAQRTLRRDYGSKNVHAGRLQPTLAGAQFQKEIWDYAKEVCQVPETVPPAPGFTPLPSN